MNGNDEEDSKSGSRARVWLNAIGREAQRLKLDRDITIKRSRMEKRKRSFGCELYDILQRGGDAEVIPLPSEIQNVESQIAESLRLCRGELDHLTREQKAKEDELANIAEQGQRRRQEQQSPNRAASDTIRGTRHWITDSGNRVRLRLELRDINQKIQHRKGIFGMEIWPYWSDTTLLPPSRGSLNVQPSKRSAFGAKSSSLQSVVLMSTQSLSTSHSNMPSPTKGEDTATQSTTDSTMAGEDDDNDQQAPRDDAATNDNALMGHPPAGMALSIKRCMHRAQEEVRELEQDIDAITQQISRLSAEHAPV